MKKQAILVASVSFMVLLGCGSKEGGATGGGPAGSAAGASAGASVSATNATLVGHVKSMVEGCTTINVDYGQAYGCKDGLESAVRKLVTESKPADFLSTLAALAGKKDDPKTAALALELLYSQWDYLGDEGKKANATPAAVDAMLALYKDANGVKGNRIAKSAVQAATLAKAYDKLFATLAAKTDAQSRSSGYENVLTYGRLEAFPKVKEGAANKENLAGALNGVRKMAKPTDAEKAAICPWAKGFLADADPKVAAAAGNDMVYCRGEYIDALLAEAETRLKNKQYKDPFAPVMREPCFQFAGALTPSAADLAQCDRVYEFLERASNDPGVDDETRGLALWNIYYQRRDEKTMKIMRKYEKSPNKAIAKRAQEAIKSLQETYKIKG